MRHTLSGGPFAPPMKIAALKIYDLDVRNKKTKLLGAKQTTSIDNAREQMKHGWRMGEGFTCKIPLLPKLRPLFFQ